MTSRGIRAGRYCEPIPTRIASSTPLVTSGEASPQPVKRPPIISHAASNESARKKIHAKQTKWKMTMRARQRVHAVDGRVGTAPPLTPEPLSDESGAVEPAPDDEGPCRAVPQPTDQHRQQQVAVGQDRTPAAVPAERDVDVVAEPAREGHVPAAPEVLDRRRGVRRVEVLGEREAEQERDPDRDVRVAGEVRVDLHGIRVDRDQDLERRVLARGGEDLVDDRRGQVVRDHHLLEEPGRDEVEGPARVDAARVAGRVELGDQLGRPHDRAGDEVGEEREVDGELLERRRLEVAAVGVDDVADRHEGVEGDADREHDRLHLERHVEPDERGQVVARGDEEVVVLEVAEDGEVAREREEEQGLALGRRPGPPDPHREHLVPEGAARRGGRRTASPTTRRRRSSRR